MHDCVIYEDWSSWLPSYLQKHFEESLTVSACRTVQKKNMPCKAQMQRGTELSALAAPWFSFCLHWIAFSDAASSIKEMVAIIEDLVHKEVHFRWTCLWYQGAIAGPPPLLCQAERQLQEIYEAMGKSTETVLDRSAALEAGILQHGMPPWTCHDLQSHPEQVIDMYALCCTYNSQRSTSTFTTLSLVLFAVDRVFLVARNISVADPVKNRKRRW